jgi:photosystem II stability/assembly factor-like uncharacterized protein
MKNNNIKVFIAAFIGLGLLLLLIRTAKAGDNIWTTNGPYGAPMRGLLIDPVDSNIIYATTDSGVYKSIDGGSTWLVSSTGLPDYPFVAWTNSIVFDPQNSSTLFLATRQGIFKSIDAGQTWLLKGTIVEGGKAELIDALAVGISPVDGTLYAGGFDDPSLPPDIAGSGIFRSRDGGETWQRLGNGAPTGNVSKIVVAPSASNIIYAGGSDIGIYKSIDGGDSWQSLNSGFIQEPFLGCIAVDPYGSQVVYISVFGQGIYRSDNGGQSWQPIGSGLNIDVRAIFIDPGNQQVIYAGGGVDTGSPGVYRSLDNHGLNWAPMMEGMGGRAVWSLAMDQNVPQNIYAGTASGIWKYTLQSGPVDYGISINDGALFTNQTTVTLTMTAPPGTTEMTISNDGGLGSASWEQFTTQKPWTITSYGTYVLPRVVYAKFKTYGQTSGLYQDDIVLDVTPPTGAINITNPVSTSMSTGYAQSLPWISLPTTPLTETIFIPLIGDNYKPGYKMIGLALSATDDVSGVGEMMIANEVSFTGDAWEPFTTSKNW